MGATDVEPARPKSHAAAVLRRLEGVYGRPSWRVGAHASPLDELIQTILSQHTSDLNSGRAFRALKEHYGTWQEVAQAPTSAVADAIRCGGLADQKARTIHGVLDRVLTGDRPKVLEDLATLPLDEAKARLTALPGVGPKTAACVLLFGCGRPALPVDTHVYRVSRRIGLIPEAITADQAHDRLEALLELADVYSFHLNLIAHGRRVCVARAPRCEGCVLLDLCEHGMAAVGFPILATSARDDRTGSSR